MDHLRPDQLAELLCLSKRTIYRAIQEKRLKTVLIRGNTWVKVPQEIKYMNPRDQLLKPTIVAKMLNVSVSAIYHHFWEGTLKGCIVLGRSVRIYTSGIVNYLEEKAKRKEEF